MFLTGLLIIYIPKLLTFKELKPIIFVFTSIVSVFIILLQTNEAFYNRIFDVRPSGMIDPGSGRLIFWAASIEMWLESIWVEKFFGIGMSGLREGMIRFIGKPLSAHSEIFDLLAGNGLIGITLFVLYLFTLFSFIWSKRNHQSFRLAMGAFALYISLMLVQGGFFFPTEVFLALIFTKLYKEDIRV